jgi:hypothetical protein
MKVRGMKLDKVKQSLKKVKLHLHPSGSVRDAFIELYWLIEHLVGYLDSSIANQLRIEDNELPLKKPELKRNGKVEKD